MYFYVLVCFLIVVYLAVKLWRRGAPTREKLASGVSTRRDQSSYDPGYVPGGIFIPGATTPASEPEPATHNDGAADASGADGGNGGGD